MKKVYGYIRVSTVKQGTGVSLQEQKEAIVRYAEKNKLIIIEWFEEQETAAKQGRPLFTKMMKLLRMGTGQGVIIHKIDRSARNLKDWAALWDLIDEGIEVHFAHESLDMDTRGGRLAADIQAVIASDYIRNLRDETIKGLYGRLKQGVYPFGAPIGYIDNGRGQYKTIDPIKGPLIRKSFELYCSGKYGLNELVDRIKELGLRNTKGGFVSVTTMSKILNNPFYAGILKVKGNSFPGGHEPLISAGLFSEVQKILESKTNSKVIKNDFIFRKLLKCNSCRKSLVGELQKGNVYYRCHAQDCPTTSIREDQIDNKLVQTLDGIQLNPIEIRLLNELLTEAQSEKSIVEKKLMESITLQIRSLTNKVERLTDAYIENIIDRNLFEGRKEKLLLEVAGLKNKEGQLSIRQGDIFNKAAQFLEFLKSFKNSYVSAFNDEKRKILKTVTSNFIIQEKKIMITMKSPFQELANRVDFFTCDLDRVRPRTCTAKCADKTTCNGECGKLQTLVADLAINPKTCVAEPINLQPILSEAEYAQLREQMQQLLDMIMLFFEEENKLVDSGKLQAEDGLFHDVQANDSSSKHNTRSLPEGFKRRRA